MTKGLTIYNDEKRNFLMVLIIKQLNFSLIGVGSVR